MFFIRTSLKDVIWKQDCDSSPGPVLDLKNFYRRMEDVVKQ